MDLMNLDLKQLLVMFTNAVFVLAIPVAFIFAAIAGFRRIRQLENRVAELEKDGSTRNDGQTFTNL